MIIVYLLLQSNFYVYYKKSKPVKLNKIQLQVHIILNTHFYDRIFSQDLEDIFIFDTPQLVFLNDDGFSFTFRYVITNTLICFVWRFTWM